MAERSADLTTRILTIEPSGDGETLYRPARVTLRSGTTLDRVYCVPASDAYENVHRLDNAIPFEEVVDVVESPFRLPAHLATRLYSEGESGMGYTIFTLVLRDGSRVPRVTGNWVDFPALPDGVEAGDIQDVLPHEGREFYRDRQAEPMPSYRWLFYPDP